LTDDRLPFVFAYWFIYSCDAKVTDNRLHKR